MNICSAIWIIVSLILWKTISKKFKNVAKMLLTKKPTAETVGFSMFCW